MAQKQGITFGQERPKVSAERIEDLVLTQRWYTEPCGEPEHTEPCIII
jgi:hypothetical protein